MDEKKEYFDNDAGLNVSPDFQSDLKNLFQIRDGISAEVDRAILDRAIQHFDRLEFSKTKQHLIRWSVVWKVAAAAAVIIFAFSLDLTLKPEVQEEPEMSRMAISKGANFDIDNNGRVDILDAFMLARRIESENYNEKQFDINNDGLVNRDDIDKIAMAAVRLNKGLL